MQLHIFHPGFPQVGYLELLAPVPGSTRMAGMWDGTFGWDACAVPDRELCTFFVGPLRNEAFTVNLSYSEQSQPMWSCHLEEVARLSWRPLSFSNAACWPELSSAVHMPATDSQRRRCRFHRDRVEVEHWNPEFRYAAQPHLYRQRGQSGNPVGKLANDCAWN